MASKLDIINEALVRIGAAPLGSLSDQNAQGLTAEQVYSAVVRDMIAAHPWSFALRQKALTQIVVSDNDRRWSDGKYVYQVPNDCLRVIGGKDTRHYQLSGDQIYTDDQEFVLVYVADVEESHWPAFFVELIALKFAAAVAISITDSGNRANIYEDLARKQAQRAMSIDAQQVPSYVYDLMRIYMRGVQNPLAGA